MCESTQGLLCPSHMKIHYWPFFRNLSQKVSNPKWTLDDLWPHISWCLMCNSTQGSVSNSHGNISKYVDTVTTFQNLSKRSMTQRWPLTPLLLRSHVWLYPRIIVFKSHENTLMYVDTVIIFAKLTTYYIRMDIRTYYVQNEWSHSLFLKQSLGETTRQCEKWPFWLSYTYRLWLPQNKCYCKVPKILVLCHIFVTDIYHTDQQEHGRCTTILPPNLIAVLSHI